MKKILAAIVIIAAAFLLLNYLGISIGIEENLTDGYSETTAYNESETEYNTEIITEYTAETSAHQTEISTQQEETSIQQEELFYTFRNDDLYDSHYIKHGAEFGNITQDEYLEMANDLINSDSPDVLHKTEKEDGDYLFYNTETNEFLVLSTDGYIRTYFKPDDGIKYWERQ